MTIPMTMILGHRFVIRKTVVFLSYSQRCLVCNDSLWERGLIQYCGQLTQPLPCFLQTKTQGITSKLIKVNCELYQNSGSRDILTKRFRKRYDYQFNNLHRRTLFQTSQPVSQRKWSLTRDGVHFENLKRYSTISFLFFFFLDWHWVRVSHGLESPKSYERWMYTLSTVSSNANRRVQ